MGYYTKYTLTVEPALAYERVADEIKRITCYEVFDGECTWHGHEKDLAEASRRHPDALICVHGDGEAHDDEWVKYFRDGKMDSHYRPPWSPPKAPDGWVPVIDLRASRSR